MSRSRRCLHEAGEIEAAGGEWRRPRIIDQVSERIACAALVFGMPSWAPEPTRGSYGMRWPRVWATTMRVDKRATRPEAIP